MRAYQEKRGGEAFLCGFFGCLFVLFLLRSGLHFVYVTAYIKVFCINTFTVTPTCALHDLE